MRTPHRTLFALFVMLGASVLISGCIPNPNPEDEVKLNLYNPDSSPTAQASPETTTTKKTTLPEKGRMKTLADFDQIKATEATIVTTKGEITFTLFREEAPLTTANFLQLAKEKYYDDIVFHRVIPDFMAQVGDPLTKDEAMKARWGTGGPGYTIADEFGPGLTHDSEGIVSMANAGPNTGGSQFFITYEATTWLDGKHAIFGKVTKGMDVLRNITVGDKIISISYK